MKGVVLVLGWSLVQLSKSLQLDGSYSCPFFDRRTILQSILASACLTTGEGPTNPALAQEIPTEVPTKPALAAYQIIPDLGPNLNPSIQPLNPDLLIKQLSSKGGALWLGEHHNSAKDHAMQEQILKNLYRERQRTAMGTSMAVGLEQVEEQFQPILDDFSAGLLTMSEMRKLVEWDKRWTYELLNFVVLSLIVSTIRLCLTQH